MKHNKAHLIKKMNALFLRLEAEGGACDAQSSLHKECIAFLTEVLASFKSLPWGIFPRITQSVYSHTLNGAPGLSYIFYFDPASAGDTAMLFLIPTKEQTLRLFTLENSVHRFYLCEHCESRHVNYGSVEENDALYKRIFEVLNEEKTD